MKTLTLPLILITVFISSCMKVEQVAGSLSIDPTIPIKSIDGYKNRKPFINYLGTQMEGC